jgi:addiction module RelE/StbE family toxin
MAEVIWREQALDDLDEIAAYIEQFDPRAADTITLRLRLTGESLRDFPHRGRPGPRATREMVTVPPYILSYEVDAETVYILAIRHGRQRPLS